MKNGHLGDGHLDNRPLRSGHHFFKTTGQGCSYSLCDDGVIHFDAVIVPAACGDVQAQARSAIERLHSLLRRERLEGCVTAHTVFLRDLNDAKVVRRLLLDYYGDHLPALTFVPQKPCDDAVVLLFEVRAMKGNPGRIRIRRISEHAVSIDAQGVSLGFFGGLVPGDGASGAYNESISALERLGAELEAAGYGISDLLRTWIYQGSIVRPEGKTQRYKELNRARTDFFEGIQFLTGFVPPLVQKAVYPASTGIGADGLGVTLAALALKTDRKDVRCVPLENPDQTPAFDYGAVYSPQSPKFSRAMALAADERCTVYVSGTASIVDSETKHLDDPAAQTRQTLENIRRLINGENLARHGIDGFDAGIENLTSARVYVKYPEHYHTIREICEKLLGSTPMIFTHSDVCRDELLVEIEGIAACTKK